MNNYRLVQGFIGCKWRALREYCRTWTLALLLKCSIASQLKTVKKHQRFLWVSPSLLRGFFKCLVNTESEGCVRERSWTQTWKSLANSRNLWPVPKSTEAQPHLYTCMCTNILLHLLVLHKSNHLAFRFGLDFESKPRQIISFPTRARGGVRLELGSQRQEAGGSQVSLTKAA